MSWLIASLEYCFQVPANAGQPPFQRGPTKDYPGDHHAGCVFGLFHLVSERTDEVELTQWGFSLSWLQRSLFSKMVAHEGLQRFQFSGEVYLVVVAIILNCHKAWVALRSGGQTQKRLLSSSTLTLKPTGFTSAPCVSSRQYGSSHR